MRDRAAPHLPEFYVLRHGETEWNRLGRFQGWSDSPLTEKGIAQAEVLGRLLASRGVTAATHRVIASTAGRARATADRVFPGSAHATDEDLREIGMGDWTGRSRPDLERAGLASDQMDLIAFYAAVPGGETFDELWARAGRVLARLDRPSVLVTHGIMSRALRARTLGLGIPGIETVQGGQGVVYRVAEGRMEYLAPDGVPVGGT